MALRYDTSEDLGGGYMAHKYVADDGTELLFDDDQVSEFGLPPPLKPEPIAPKPLAAPEVAPAPIRPPAPSPLQATPQQLAAAGAPQAPEPMPDQRLAFNMEQDAALPPAPSPPQRQPLIAVPQRESISRQTQTQSTGSNVTGQTESMAGASPIRPGDWRETELLETQRLANERRDSLDSQQQQERQILEQREAQSRQAAADATARELQAKAELDRVMQRVNSDIATVNSEIDEVSRRKIVDPTEMQSGVETALSMLALGISTFGANMGGHPNLVPQMLEDRRRRIIEQQKHEIATDLEAAKNRKSDLFQLLQLNRPIEIAEREVELAEIAKDKATLQTQEFADAARQIGYDHEAAIAQIDELEQQKRLELHNMVQANSTQTMQRQQQSTSSSSTTAQTDVGFIDPNAPQERDPREVRNQYGEVVDMANTPEAASKLNDVFIGIRESELTLAALEQAIREVPRGAILGTKEEDTYDKLVSRVVKSKAKEGGGTITEGDMKVALAEVGINASSLLTPNGRERALHAIKDLLNESHRTAASIYNTFGKPAPPPRVMASPDDVAAELAARGAQVTSPPAASDVARDEKAAERRDAATGPISGKTSVDAAIEAAERRERDGQ